MPVNKKEITKEMIRKAMQCKDADELMALAKANGFDITKDEAEAYFSEIADVELDGDVLKSVAGGHDYFCWHCPTDFDCTKNK
jgi:predicted ribosomally synthesized peptide with nif11-like leader